MQHPSSLIADTLSALAILGTILGYLPYLAAIAGLLWYLIQIKESSTVQKWLSARQERRRTLRMAKLRLREQRLKEELEQLERT